MPDKPLSDLNALAIEALDLWQEHLAALASDPTSKADLARILEPQRRLFAEWMKKAQDVSHGTASFVPTQTSAATNPASGAATLRSADDDGSLSLAQLTLRVAELEKRVAQLESGQPRTAGTASRHPQRT